MDHKFAARPETIGLDPQKLTDLTQRVRQEVDEGLLPSAQIAVAREGRIGLFETFGEADNDTMYCVFSSTKAVMSAAAWLLIAEGQLDVTERVAAIVPEFATNGKEIVTVEQLFLHSAGFPSAPFRPLEWDDREARLARFSRWRLNWPPGSRFEYHPTSSMWVIAEIVERRTGKDFRDFIRERVIEPLELTDLYVGLPVEENHRVSELMHVGDGLTSEDYARLGVPEPPVTEVTEEAILTFNRPEFRAVGVPGGGGFATAAGLALFYQGLLHGGALGGPVVWTGETLAMGLEVRSGDLVDPLYGRLVNRALGVVVSGGADRNFRGFGHRNSPSAFGHGGAGGQIAWADPATGISIGYCTNGHDRNPLRLGRRGVAISNRAAVCLAG